MTVLRVTYKLIGFICLVALYFSVTPLVALTTSHIWQRRKRLATVTSFFARRTLRLLKITVLFDQQECVNSTTSQLIVSNHLSYLDVVIMAAQKPLVFVTSIEIKNTPFLGQITELAGCLYVERRSRANLNIEINDIKEGLSHNLSVCVFPEATSTNGDTVLRFKRPLFHAALMAERPVLPLCLNYLTINNKKVDIHNRDNVAWYGDMDFFPHLIGVMQKKNITVALCIENEILPTQHITADELALASHHAVSKMFRPLSLSFE